MNGFLGRYEYQMDEKGRVALPSAFRREADDDRFVLLQWEEPYLTLFPQTVWAAKQQELLQLRRSGPEGQRYVRGLLSMAVEVNPDKQGRILIPGWLQEAASLDGSVLLNGNIDRIEIWDPDTYGREQRPELEGQVAAFAKRILG